jgi:hypothetical protein
MGLALSVFPYNPSASAAPLSSPAPTQSAPLADSQAASLRQALQAALEPEPGFAELGGQGDRLDEAGLERAALLASGLRADRIGPYQATIVDLLNGLKSEASGLSDPAAKGEAALAYLHKRVLKSYREDSSRLDELLNTGRFNCVSSAVLYAIACRSLGLEVSGIRTEDHAFCSVLASGRAIDVETTNPYGFDPGNKKEFKDSFGKTTGYAYVAPGAYSNRRAISAPGLVGLILCNRASLLERSDRYLEAIGLASDYQALCPGPESKLFLLDRVGNLVAYLSARGDFAGAEAAASTALEALPGEARIASLERTAAYNRAVAAAKAGDWASAFDLATALSAGATANAGASATTVTNVATATSATTVANDAALDRAMRDLVSSSLESLGRSIADGGDYDAARRAIEERSARAGPAATAAALAAIGDLELSRAANGLPFAEAAQAADRLLAEGSVSPDRYAQAIAAIYGNEAIRMGKSGDWLGGATLAESGATIVASATTVASAALDSGTRIEARTTIEAKPPR